MKSLEDFKKYYYTELIHLIEPLEVERKKVLKKIIVISVCILPIGILGAILTRHFALLIISCVLIGFIYYMVTRDYASEFKNKIIKSIVRFIDKNLNYSKKDFIEQYHFTGSKIFQKRPDKYHGDDFVSGKIGLTQVSFSEIHAQYITRDSRGRRQNHTIFKGLFFVADFNKHFKGATVVLPDVAEKLFGHLGTMLQSMNKFRGQLIKLEDPEFEKMFAVYGDDQIEARYILSTSLVQRITEFKKKTKRIIHMSFVGSKIYVAISYAKDLFEPKVFSTLYNFKPMREYFEDLQAALGIVEDLNLNIRIWSKQ